MSYQQAQAVLIAVEMLDDPALTSVRIEGEDDVIDIETLGIDGITARAWQVKTRADAYTWSRSDLLEVLERWASLPAAESSSFVFLTDGRLGPSARELELALDDAKGGNTSPLDSFLGADCPPLASERLASATLQVDASSPTTLLYRAERQVAAMLPDVRTVDDAMEQASAAIGRLFRAVFVKAGNHDAAARRLSRSEIADLLGVRVDWTATRWVDGVDAEYITAVQKFDQAHVVEPAFLEWSVSGPASEQTWLSVEEALNLSTPMVVSGPTGSGKTTAAEVLRFLASRHQRPVLVARAEAYLPGRLEALAADAIADVLDRDIPRSVGRAALNDKRVTLAIDGVSEIPAKLAEELKKDVTGLVLRTQGPRLILLGRDLAVTRQILPASPMVRTVTMARFDREGRQRLAETQLGLHAAKSTTPTPSPALLVTRIEHVLGDAAGNPMLFAMAAELALGDRLVDGRAALYGMFIEHLAERAGVSDIFEVRVALGTLFSMLLDAGRRYADPYEYQRLLVDSCQRLRQGPFEVDPAAVDESARRAGVVVPIGFNRTVSAIHDSFADFLAGDAMARGVVALPTELGDQDDQRIIFASELGALSQELARLVAGWRPFLAANIAQHDSRGLDRDSPLEVSKLLHELLPPGEHHGVQMWAQSGGRVTAARSDAQRTSWLHGNDGRKLLDGSAVIVDAPNGPLTVAAALWRQFLHEALRSDSGYSLRRATTQEEARDQVEAHAREVRTARKRLVESVAPRGASSVLERALPPAGLTARIHPPESGLQGRTFPLTYRRTSEVKVLVASETEKPTDDWTAARSSVLNYVERSPRSQAIEDVRKSIDDLAGTRFV